MNKKQFYKWVNDFPVLEAMGVFLIILFLTIGIINVLMGEKLIGKDLLDKFLEQVIKNL
jgi:hypothetical protein